MTARSPLERDLAHLVGEAGVAPADDFARFEQAARYGGGRARAVVRPKDTAEVAAVVRYAYAHDLRLVPQGANTGLVAASTPDMSGEQLVLSFERLQWIEALDRASRSVIVGAGTRLSQVNAAAAEVGLSFPIDLGADPSIGGMIATNTGGARLIRYGDVRRNLLGLEVVIADQDASVLTDLRDLRKNNSGLDLKSLFAGSGGGLGLVTRACLNLHRLPRQTATALAIPVDHAALPGLITRLEDEAGEFLTAVEGLSHNAMMAALRHHPRLRNPFGAAEPPPYALLVELTSTAPAETGIDVEDLLVSVLGRCLEGPEALLTDALVGRGHELWDLRHAVSEGLKQEGRVIAFDLSLPRSRLPAFRAEMSAEIAARFPFLRLCDFGHIGDGGDHFNLVWPHDAAPAYDAEVVRQVRDLVYDRAVLGHGGGFSAEHGLGPYNLDYYRRYTPPQTRAVAAALKRQLDPKGLLGHVDFS
jgi:FAD/FMN-containing dehydrogenase